MNIGKEILTPVHVPLKSPSKYTYNTLANRECNIEAKGHYSTVSHLISHFTDPNLTLTRLWIESVLDTRYTEIKR